MAFDPNSLLVQGFILAMGVIGQYLVAHQRVQGFYFWCAGNVFLIATNIYFGSWGAVVLYVYFSVMSLYSVRKWKRIELVKQHNAPLEPGNGQTTTLEVRVP